MKITVDTSVIIAVVTNEPHKGSLVAATRESELVAPSSLPWEIGNAFSAMLRRERITVEQARAAVLAYGKIPVQLVDVPLVQALEIANEQKIYAYDAYMVACALQHRAPLLSLDARLRAAALASGARVVELEV